MAEKKLWGGRFTESTDALVEELNASIGFDKKLYRQDIAGSIAHARMLSSCGLISSEDLTAIERGLREVAKEMDSGAFQWRIDREDIHMNVEAALREKIGAPAGRLHTARSRNDQVALDIRLWLRQRILDTVDAIGDLQEALIGLAERGKDFLMPGYTHLQRAQPVNAGHHMLAYVEMLERDAHRLLDGFKRTNICPLGSGALAGTPFPIDREQVARTLGFDGITHNSMDGVSDRDFAVEFLATAALCQVHLSRLSEESSSGPARSLDSFSCPTVSAPVRASCLRRRIRIFRNWFGEKPVEWLGSRGPAHRDERTPMLAYNKDMQEDKEPLFDGVETLLRCLEVTARMMTKAEWKPERLRAALNGGFLTATDLADFLVENGMPFRDAHEVSGTVVAHCVENNKELEDLTDEELERFTHYPAEKVRPSLDPARSVARRTQHGAPAQVGSAIEAARSRLSDLRKETEKAESTSRPFSPDHRGLAPLIFSSSRFRNCGKNPFKEPKTLDISIRYNP